MLEAFETHYDTLAKNSMITFAEIVAGLTIGTMLGAISALIMILWKPTETWLMPVLVVSGPCQFLLWLPFWCCGWVMGWLQKSPWLS